MGKFVYVDEDYKSEQIWKDVVGYEGLYKVSEHGEIISLGCKTNHIKPILLTSHPDRDDYLYVILANNKIRRTLRVHRIVAQTFWPNPQGHAVINHIDEDRQNNHYTNLEWCDYEHNWRVGSVGRSQQLVGKFSMGGVLIETYPSLMEAGRCNNINQGNITNCLKGRCKSVGGYKWKLL